MIEAIRPRRFRKLEFSIALLPAVVMVVPARSQPSPAAGGVELSQRSNAEPGLDVAAPFIGCTQQSPSADTPLLQDDPSSDDQEAPQPPVILYQITDVGVPANALASHAAGISDKGSVVGWLSGRGGAEAAALSRWETLFAMKKSGQHPIAEVPGRHFRTEMTIGIDLGDVWSHYCTLNEEGEVVDQSRFRTTPKAVEKWFTDLAPDSIATLLIRHRLSQSAKA